VKLHRLRARVDTYSDAVPDACLIDDYYGLGLVGGWRVAEAENDDAGDKSDENTAADYGDDPGEGKSLVFWVEVIWVVHPLFSVL